MHGIPSKITSNPEIIPCSLLGHDGLDLPNDLSDSDTTTSSRPVSPASDKSQNETDSIAMHSSLLRIERISRDLLIGSLDQLKDVIIKLDSLTLGSNVSFKGKVTFQIESSLRLPIGSTLTGYSDVHICASKVINSNACLQVHENLYLKCDYLDNTSNGKIDVNGNLAIFSDQVNNNSGIIRSKYGEIKWQYIDSSEFININGRVIAMGRIHLCNKKGQFLFREGKFLNRAGKLVSQQSNVEAWLHCINNKNGKIFGQNISFSFHTLDNNEGRIECSRTGSYVGYKSILNSHGIISGEMLGLIIGGAIVNCGGSIIAKKWAELSARSFSLVGVENLSEFPKGKIVTTDGGIVLKSDEPLLLNNDLVASSTIQILCPMGMVIVPNTSLIARNTVSIDCELGQGNIELKKGIISADMLKLEAPLGSVKVSELKGRASLIIKAQNKVQIDKSNLFTPEAGISIEVEPQGFVSVHGVRIKGSGELRINGATHSDSYKRVPCKVLELSDSRLELNDCKLQAKSLVLNRTGLSSNGRCTFSASQIGIKGSAVQCTDVFTIDSEKKIKVCDAKFKAVAVLIRSMSENIFLYQVSLQSKIKTIILANHKNIFFSGKLHSKGDFFANAADLRLENLLGWVKDSADIIARQTLVLQNVDLEVCGKSLSLDSAIYFEITQSILFAPQGKLHKFCKQNMIIDKLSTLSDSLMIRAEKIKSSFAKQRAYHKLGHYGSKIDLENCSLTVRPINGGTSNVDDELPDKIVLNSLVSLYVKNTSLSSDSCGLQSNQIKIADSNFTHEQLNITAQNSIEALDVISEGKNIALQAIKILTKNIQLNVKNLQAKARSIRIESSTGVVRDITLQANETLNIHNSQFQAKNSYISSNRNADFNNVAIVGKNVKLRAERLKLQQTFLQTSSVDVEATQSFDTEELNLNSADLSIDAPIQNHTSSQFNVEHRATLKACIVMGRKVTLVVRDGNAQIRACFASFTELMMAVERNCDLKAHFAQLVASNVRIGHTFRVHATSTLILERAALAAGILRVDANFGKFRESSLGGRKSVHLLGIQQRWETVETSSGGEFEADINQTIEFKKSQLSASSIAIIADRLHLSQSKLLAKQNLNLFALHQKIQSSLLDGEQITIDAQNLLALQSTFLGRRKISISASFQTLIANAICSDGVFQQTGKLLIGIGNTIRGRNLQQKGLLILSIRETKEATKTLQQWAILQLKLWGVEKGSFIFEGIPFQFNCFMHQKAGAIVSFAITSNLFASQVASRALCAHSFWNIRAKRTHLNAMFGHLVSHRGKIIAPKAQISGDFVFASAPMRSINAPNSVWNAKFSDLFGRQLLLQGAQVHPQLIPKELSYILNLAPKLVAGTAKLRASNHLDLRDASLEGFFCVQAPKILGQGTKWVSHSAFSKIVAKSFQTDNAVEFLGTESLHITLDGPQINGLAFVDGVLAIRSNAPNFVNNVRSVCDVLSIQARGNLQNKQAQFLRLGQISITGKFTNFKPIQGMEKLRVSAKKIEQFSDGALASVQLSIHQDEPLQMGQLGQLIGNDLLELSSNERAHIDHKLQLSGALRVISRKFGGEVRLLAPVTANGPIELMGRNIDIENQLKTAGKLSLQAGELIALHDKVTALNGFYAEGQVLHNAANTIEVKGLAKLKVGDFFNESVYLPEQFGNVAHPKPVLRAIFHIDGDLIADVKNRAHNIGGEVLVTGRGEFTAKKLQNSNLTHSHTYTECLGFKQKRFLGFKVKKNFLYAPRTVEIVDAGALFDFGKKFTLNIKDHLENSGVLRAAEISGTIGNLSISHLLKNGRAPRGLEIRTGLPYATIFSAGKLGIDVANHTKIKGRMVSGGDMAFSTKTLDVSRRSVTEMVPFVKERWLKTDRISWRPTQHLDAGGKIIAKGHAEVVVNGKVIENAATVRAGGNLKFHAESMDIGCGEEIQRANVSGSCGFLQSREKHAAHTTFHPSRMLADGVVDMKIDGLLRNCGSEIIGAKGTKQQQGQLIETVPVAINCVERSSGLFGGSERNVGISSELNVGSPSGNTAVLTKGTADYAGTKVGKDWVILKSGDKGNFHAFSQPIWQKDSEVNFDGLSISWQREKFQQLHAVVAKITAQNIEVHSGESIHGIGAQLLANKTLLLNAPHLSWDSHHHSLHSETSGGEFGISFPGSKALKALFSDGSAKKAAKELILSDPLVNKAHSLIEAEQGSDVALGSIMVLAEGYKAATHASLAQELGAGGARIGERMGLFDQSGNLSLKVALYVQQCTQSQEVNSSLSGILAAGESITITSNQQRYSGVDIVAPSVTFAGQNGQKAEIDFVASEQTMQQLDDSQGVSLSFHPTGAVIPGANISEGDAFAKFHRHSTVNAEHIHWNAQRVGLQGANVHGDRQTGEIGQLDVTSLFDERRVRSDYFGADALGNISIGNHDLDRRTIQQSTFTTNDGSELAVGKAHLVGGALLNIHPNQTTGRDLREYHFEKRRTITINMKEVRQVIEKAGASQSAISFSSVGTGALDPRLMPPFFNLGTYSRTLSTGSGIVRATAAGTLAPHNLNHDFARIKDPLHISKSRVEVDFLVPNTAVIGKQWESMSRRQTPALPSIAMISQEDEDQITKTFEKALIETDPELQSSPVNIIAIAEAYIAGEEKRKNIHGNAPSIRLISALEPTLDVSENGVDPLTGRVKNELAERYIVSCKACKAKRDDFALLLIACNNDLSRRPHPEDPTRRAISIRTQEGYIEMKECFAESSRLGALLLDKELRYAEDASKTAKLRDLKGVLVQQCINSQRDADGMSSVRTEQIAIEIAAHESLIKGFLNGKTRHTSKEKEQITLHKERVDEWSALKRQADRRQIWNDAIEKSGNHKLQETWILYPEKISSLQKNLDEQCEKIKGAKYENFYKKPLLEYDLNAYRNFIASEVIVVNKKDFKTQLIKEIAEKHGLPLELTQDVIKLNTQIPFSNFNQNAHKLATVRDYERARVGVKFQEIPDSPTFSSYSGTFEMEKCALHHDLDFIKLAREREILPKAKLGSYSSIVEKPGIYVVQNGKTPEEARCAIHEAFHKVKCITIHMNGMQCNLKNAFENAKYESAMQDNRPVLLVFGPTFGPGTTGQYKDIAEIVRGISNKSITETVLLTSNLLENCLEYEDLDILLKPHSRGSIYAEMAMKGVKNMNKKQRVHLRGSGAVQLIDKELCNDAIFFQASNDKIAKVFVDQKDQRLRIAPSHFINNIDHDYTSQTLYKERKRQFKIDFSKFNKSK